VSYNETAYLCTDTCPNGDKFAYIIENERFNASLYENAT